MSCPRPTTDRYRGVAEGAEILQPHTEQTRKDLFLTDFLCGAKLYTCLLPYNCQNVNLCITVFLQPLTSFCAAYRLSVDLSVVDHTINTVHVVLK